MTCRVVCRALLIPFLHQLDYNIQSSAAIHDAAPAASGHEELSDIKAHVTCVLTGVDARIIMEYSVLIASALLVCFPPLHCIYCMCMSLTLALIQGIDSRFVD